MLSKNKSKIEQVMNSIYVVSVIVLVRLFINSYRNNNENSNEIVQYDTNSEDLSDNKSFNEIPLVLGKNKWLHPDDEFVKFKKAKHYKSETYDI